MEKKGHKKQSKKIKEETKSSNAKELPKEFPSVVKKNNQIFIVVSAKPGSKTDAITAVEPDYVGVSV